MTSGRRLQVARPLLDAGQLRPFAAGASAAAVQGARRVVSDTCLIVVRVLERIPIGPNRDAL